MILFDCYSSFYGHLLSFSKLKTLKCRYLATQLPYKSLKNWSKMSQNMKIMAFSGDLLNRQTQAWFIRMIFKANKIEAHAYIYFMAYCQSMLDVVLSIWPARGQNKMRLGVTLLMLLVSQVHF